MQSELLELLDGRRGHFQMESGYHGELWFDLNALLAQTERLRPFVTELGRRLAVHRVDAICGPLIGGAQLAQAIAHELGAEYLFTERVDADDDAGFFPVRYTVPAALRERARNRRIALVDDAISAGSAVRGTYADLIQCGAKPVVIGALLVFGDNGERFATDHDLALEGIARMKFNVWTPEQCPLCKSGVTLEKVSDAAPGPRCVSLRTETYS